MPAAIDSVTAPPPPTPQILFIDAYDSFANSVVGLIEQTFNAHVTIVQVDDERVSKNLRTVLQYFDAVVVGPGPGHPANPADIGLINQLWDFIDGDVIPVFGICLGFQSMALAAGADVKRLKSPCHGIVSKIQHCDFDVFEGVGDLEATQYHSLYADISHPLQVFGASITGHDVWSPTKKCPTIQPLAWKMEDEANGPVLMALKHTVKPFWGVQFHPESICTNSEGHKIIQNWWEEAQLWSRTMGRVCRSLDGKTIHQIIGELADFRHILPQQRSTLLWSSVPMGDLSAIEICEAMGLTRQDIILLDSQGHKSGRYSIIGLVVPNLTSKLSYKVKDKQLLHCVEGGRSHHTQVDSIEEMWNILRTIMDAHQMDCSMNPEDSPFWGGLMGYISYEAGLETLDVCVGDVPDDNIPDLNFAFIHRSVVLDHVSKTIYVQSLFTSDEAWLSDTRQILESLASRQKCASNGNHLNGTPAPETLKDAKADDELLQECLRRAYIEKPRPTEYRDQVLRCQDFLLSGDSYELCLTGETTISIPRTESLSLDPWIFYKSLRRSNPAPFGAYINLPGVRIASTSPERFLRWTREGHVQYRPIKGTVKKVSGIDFASASAILNTSKERAENLMIVDLIRHDLSGIVGAHNCSVPKLMQVEEYETVFQLVSVIEGQLPRRKGLSRSLVNGSKVETNGHTLPPVVNGSTESHRSPKPSRQPEGIDILKASLPPGSMTGAPKKRSCQILKSLEKRPRGVYSGIIGYMDVGGGGDFSVVIRTAVQRKGETSHRPLKPLQHEVNGSSISDQAVPHEVWRVGAGGAVTIQSTDVGELEEMETKLDSVLKIFAC